ncbi:hypothetical protein [Melissospora conviva]|uniref:hypothetical protein n=1 Tax=Melissospora conviva TaxID=3388432 RepID=UPI003C1F527C
MDFLQGLGLALALLTLACLPAVLVLIVCADELTDRIVCGYGAWRKRRAERRTIARLDRAIEVESFARDLDLREFDRPDRRCIEQIAADLWRLGGQRLGTGRSAVWQSAVLRAYDDRLKLASHCLGVAEHLNDLSGVDLVIERIRVEGELQAAGLALPAARGEQHPRYR